MTTLNDRVGFCVVKAGCPGPSFLTEVGVTYGVLKNADKWICHSCMGYTIVPENEQPAQPRPDHVSSR